jgi:hypothetical protein
MYAYTILLIIFIWFAKVRIIYDLTKWNVGFLAIFLLLFGGVLKSSAKIRYNFIALWVCVGLRGIACLFRAINGIAWDCGSQRGNPLALNCWR